MKSLIVVIAVMLVGACGGGSAAVLSFDGGIGGTKDGGGVITNPIEAGMPDVAQDADGPQVPIAPVLTDGGSPSDAPVSGDCNPVQPYVADQSHIACAPGQTCGFVVPDQSATECGGPVGSGSQGEGCEGVVDCAPGYDCTVVDSYGQCARYCRYGGGFDDCGSRYTCTAFLSPAYDGAQEIGVCL